MQDLAMNYGLINVRGHIVGMEQYVDSAGKPKQSLPLNAGLGFLHSRVLCTRPLPQVTEQNDHSLHSPKRPLTEI